MFYPLNLVVARQFNVKAPYDLTTVRCITSQVSLVSDLQLHMLPADRVQTRSERVRVSDGLL